LLLLSVRNADKALKPGDATYLQRLDMMTLLAKDIYDKDAPAYDANVAVAIIDEPTFVGKAAALLAFFRQRFSDFSSTSTPPTPPTPPSNPQLIFLQG